MGLIPTFFIRTSELGRISPAAAKYTAEEISPGTVIRFPYSSGVCRIMAVEPWVRISAPKNFSISSVWFLESWGSVTLVSPSA